MQYYSFHSKFFFCYFLVSEIKSNNNNDKEQENERQQIDF